MPFSWESDGRCRCVSGFRLGIDGDVQVCNAVRLESDGRCRCASGFRLGIDGEVQVCNAVRLGIGREVQVCK